MEKYWNKRYANGLTSGDGSIGCLKDFKWGIIDKYVGDISQKSVIDVGCGDLSFWEGKDCDEYTGIDISNVVIEHNKEKAKKLLEKFGSIQNLILASTEDLKEILGIQAETIREIIERKY